MNRLYVVESLMTLTGVNADHRLRVPASAVVADCRGVGCGSRWQTGARALRTWRSLRADAGFAAKWIDECAKDLLQNRGQSLVVAGYRQPLAVHLLAHALNAALGNVGKTVVFHEAPEVEGRHHC